MHSLMERPWHRTSVESQLRLWSLLMAVTAKEDDETKTATVKMRIVKAGGEEELPIAALGEFYVYQGKELLLI